MYNPLSGSKVGPRLLNTILNVNNLSVREQKLVQEIARMITEKNVDLDVNLMNQVITKSHVGIRYSWTFQGQIIIYFVSFTFNII